MVPMLYTVQFFTTCALLGVNRLVCLSFWLFNTFRPYCWHCSRCMTMFEAKPIVRKCVTVFCSSELMKVISLKGAT